MKLVFILFFWYLKSKQLYTAEVNKKHSWDTYNWLY